MLLLLSSKSAATKRHVLRGSIRALSVALHQSPPLPTRHSRHLPPPICRDVVELQDLTDELRYVKLKPYTLSQESNVWEANDVIIQKAEYTIRGHAACIPNTLWYLPLEVNQRNVLPAQHHVNAMQGILQQLQEQNKVYMTLRRQLKSQVTDYDSETTFSHKERDEDSHHPQHTSTSDDDSMAGPGTTVEMWDTLLDSMAVSLPTTSPAEYKTTLEKVLLRHYQDGGFEYNVNPHTVPTVLTFNAVLRGVANTLYNGEDPIIRDDALETAFGVYDEMRWHVDRNSATFQYMLEVVRKFLPPSRSRGNIAHGLWTQAKRHHVASSQVLKALHAAHSPSNGEEFDEWLKHHDVITKTPLEWRKEHKRKRCYRSDATY